MLRRETARLVVSLSAVFFAAATLFAQTPVRMSWQTFAKDPKRVESFRKAVFVMKTANLTPDQTTAAYRVSWDYWGNMHGYFGSQSKFGTIMDWVKLRGIDLSVSGIYFSGVSNLTPPDSVAKDVWSQCQHSSRTAGVTPYFFPWHRLYLLYFEKVLQKAANDPSLRLPYWDYTDPANVAMPAEFMTPTYTNASGDVVPNPLYEVRRAPGWLSPPFSTLDPTVTNINNALKDYDDLLDTKDANGDVVPGYQSTIEQSPHGDVHCAVMDCPVPVMGAVPYSSNDPIFWLHHCNIDRMWDCWLSISGHSNPTDDAFLNQPFSFVDQNRNEVTKTVRDIISGGMVDYVYEKASNCARPEPVLYAAVAATTKMTAKQVKSARVALARPVVLGSTNAVAIDTPTTKSLITLPAATSPKAQMRDLAILTQTDVPVETDLVLRGIHYETHPGTIFKVYLERIDDPSRRAFAGSLSFFTPLEGSDRLDRVFDVTDALRSLGGQGLQEVNVVFEAATGRTGADRVHFNTHAKLAVDGIELRVKLRQVSPK